MDHVWEVHNDVSSYLFDSHQAAEWFKNLQPATLNMQLTQRKVMVTKSSDDLVAEVVQRALEYYATAYGDLTLTSSVIARAVAGSLDENERSAKAVALADKLGYCWTGTGWLKATSLAAAERESLAAELREMAEEAYSLTEEARSLLDRAADALATEPAPTPEDKPFPGRIVGGATLADRLRAKEAQEIASKFDTRAALEQARKDRATMPAPAERPVEQHFEKHLQTYAEKHHAALVRQLAGALLEARNKLATTPAPAPEGEPTTGQLLMGLAIIRELTGTQQQDLKATIEAVRKALAATPALANNADTERLDYLQKGGVTLHLVPDHEDPGNAFAYKFCVGGLWKATSRDLREAIDTSKAMQKANQNG